MIVKIFQLSFHVFCECLSSGDLFIFSVRISSFFVFFCVMPEEDRGEVMESILASFKWLGMFQSVTLMSQEA